METWQYGFLMTATTVGGSRSVSVVMTGDDHTIDTVRPEIEMLTALGVEGWRIGEPHRDEVPRTLLRRLAADGVRVGDAATLYFMRRRV